MNRCFHIIIAAFSLTACGTESSPVTPSNGGEDVAEQEDVGNDDEPEVEPDGGEPDITEADAGSDAEIDEPCECDDGDACNGAETCDPDTGDCLPGQAVVCDDDNACNGLETCATDTGECQPGTPVECDDSDACNGLETCDTNSGECIAGEPVVCDDDNACNGLETCDAGSGECIAGEPVICTDEDACNGLETCVPETGDCLEGDPIVCTDGDPCNGIETCDSGTGECLEALTFSCPRAPEACDQDTGVGGHEEGRVVSAEHRGFRLVDDDSWEDYSDLIDRIEAHRTVLRVPLEEILEGDLNRGGGSINVDGIGCFNRGFWWNEGDREVDYWWPQGVTGSADHDASGRFDNRRVMLVSWYHKPEEDSRTDFPKGVRISIVDHTNTGNIRYRHALLAQPVEVDGQVDLRPIAGRTDSVHAGGIVWAGDYLYIASTGSGFRVFDMSRILRVRDGQRNTLGLDPDTDEFHAYNYDYVIPEVGRYRLCDSSCCARFSWVSLDRTSDPHRLVAGEYVADDDDGRMHVWPIGQDGRLVEQEGGTDAIGAYYPGVRRMQGGAIVDGRFYISSSDPNIALPPSAGSFFYASGVDSSMSRRRYPFLPEDLYYIRDTDELWTCTEYPASFLQGETRYCFSVQTADVRNGCD